MSFGTRAQLGVFGARPLADTASGAAGELTGTERARVQASTHDDVQVTTNSGLTIRTIAGRIITLTLNLVTQAAAGLMSATDKTKLDNLQSIYTLAADLTLTANQLAVRLVTTAVNGLMSAADKVRLDAIGNSITTALGANQTLTTTITLIITANIATAGRYFVTLTMDAEGVGVTAAGDVAVGYLYINGVQQAQQLIFGTTAGRGRSTVSRIYPVNLAIGDTLSFYVQRLGATGTYTVAAQHTTLSYTSF